MKVLTSMFYRILITLFFGGIALFLGYPLVEGIMEGSLSGWGLITIMSSIVLGFFMYLIGVRYNDDGDLFAGLDRPFKFSGNRDPSQVLKKAMLLQIFLTVGLPLLFGQTIAKIIILVVITSLATVFFCIVIAIWWYKLPRQPREPRQK